MGKPFTKVMWAVLYRLNHRPGKEYIGDGSMSTSREQAQTMLDIVHRDKPGARVVKLELREIPRKRREG